MLVIDAVSMLRVRKSKCNGKRTSGIRTGKWRATEVSFLQSASRPLMFGSKPFSRLRAIRDLRPGQI